jgi:hypothetical protein
MMQPIGTYPDPAAKATVLQFVPTGTVGTGVPVGLRPQDVMNAVGHERPSSEESVRDVRPATP